MADLTRLRGCGGRACCRYAPDRSREAWQPRHPLGARFPASLDHVYGLGLNELKKRSVADILIAVVDGLKGFPEALNAVFPETIVQTCIVHLIRNSMSFASWKDRKLIAQALRSVYRAETPAAGLAALEAFEEGPCGKKAFGHRPELATTLGPGHPIFRVSLGVRRIIYTTNAIEALNSKVRRAVRTRGHLIHDG